MLIGEAPCMKDMIDTTDHDFQVVNTVSIIAIFLIILLVEKSLTLPFILIAVIELAIFINLGLPHYLGQSLPFIAPICISTIQLGATVDYAILMTTRYKAERVGGSAKREAVTTALSASVPSIHRQRSGAVRRHLRRGRVLRYGHHPLHVHADGPGRSGQHGLRTAVPARLASAAG